MAWRTCSSLTAIPPASSRRLIGKVREPGATAYQSQRESESESERDRQRERERERARARHAAPDENETAPASAGHRVAVRAARYQ
jgi:hypothetical protein